MTGKGISAPDADPDPGPEDDEQHHPRRPQKIEAGEGRSLTFDCLPERFFRVVGWLDHGLWLANEVEPLVRRLGLFIGWGGWPISYQLQVVESVVCVHDTKGPAIPRRGLQGDFVTRDALEIEGSVPE